LDGRRNRHGPAISQRQKPFWLRLPLFLRTPREWREWRQQSQDWRDEVITSLAKAQRSLNDFAETSVAELTALSREFNKVGLAKAREFLWAAERQIATKDYTDAKQSLMEAATMFEKAQQVEGMERQDWIDDVVSGLGKAQKAVNDFAEKATPVIDRSLKALEQALSGR